MPGTHITPHDEALTSFLTDTTLPRTRTETAEMAFSAGYHMGALAERERIVAQLLDRWPGTKRGPLLELLGCRDG